MLFDHLVRHLVEHARAQSQAPLAQRHRDEQRDNLERSVVERDVALSAALQDVIDKFLALCADGAAQHSRGFVAGLARPHRVGQRADSQHETNCVLCDDRQHVRGRRVLFGGLDHPGSPSCPGVTRTAWRATFPCSRTMRTAFPSKRARAARSPPCSRGHSPSSRTPEKRRRGFPPAASLCPAFRASDLNEKLQGSGFKENMNCEQYFENTCMSTLLSLWKQDKTVLL